jgi:hypothetical protein
MVTKKKYQNHKIHQTMKQKAGCDVPFLPDTDGVWERTNGIKSGKFYDVLQFYKFIDWTTCNQMYKLGSQSKLSDNKKDSLQITTEAALNNAFDGYTIYDTTLKIKNKSHSFMFGNATIDKVNKKVIFTQAPQDSIAENNILLEYSFNYNDDVNMIIEKDKKELFIFSNKDAEFTLGLKTGYELPGTRIKKMMNAMRQNRKTIEMTEDQLTQTQKKKRQIFSSRPSKKNNLGGGKTRIHRGGNDNPKVYTIANNGIHGHPEDKGMSNQCLWISICDYLKTIGINTSVRTLKHIGGINKLNKDYDNMEFDIYKKVLKDNIENICNHYKLRLEFIYIYQGKIANYCLSDDKKQIKPFQIINSAGQNTVLIATYGRHFELIVKIGEDPNPLYKFNDFFKKNLTYAPNEYQEKVEVTNIKQIVDTDGVQKEIFEFEFIPTTDIGEEEQQNLKMSALTVSFELFNKNIETYTEEMNKECGRPIKEKATKKHIIELDKLIKVNTGLFNEINNNMEYKNFIEDQASLILANKLRAEEQEKAKAFASLRQGKAADAVKAAAKAEQERLAAEKAAEQERLAAERKRQDAEAAAKAFASLRQGKAADAVKAAEKAAEKTKEAARVAEKVQALRAAQAAKKAEAAEKAAEAKKAKAAEQERLAEAKKAKAAEKAAEQERLAEAKKAEEQKRLAAERKRKDEEKAAKEAAKAEAAKKAEEEKRLRAIVTATNPYNSQLAQAANPVTRTTDTGKKQTGV